MLLNDCSFVQDFKITMSNAQFNLFLNVKNFNKLRVNGVTKLIFWGLRNEGQDWVKQIVIIRDNIFKLLCFLKYGSDIFYFFLFAKI